MIAPPARPRRQMLDGTARVFCAELLVLPTGLLISAFLSRRLGVAAYGLFTLAITVASWIEWCVTSIFSRATIKLAADARNWRPIGTTLVRLHLLAGTAAAAALWLLAPALGRLLREAELAAYLRLFALDIPLFSLSQAHRNLLVGIGGFRERAYVTAGRWLARLLLVLLLVGAGFSIRGAIWGSIGASLVELAVSRRYVRPSLRGRGGIAARQLWEYATPLFLAAVSARLYERIDLFALKALGGTARQAGIYAAAQNLAVLPAIFALAFSPLLLATLSRLFAAGDRSGARALSRDALRIALWLLPLAGMVAGTAPEILGWIFGRPFLPAAPLLRCLSFAAVGVAMISIALSILTAAGRPRWTFWLTGPLVPLALAGHLMAIPRWGSLGAAAVTTTVVGVGAGACVLAVYCCCGVLPPWGSACRSVLIGGGAAALAAGWPAPGFLLLLKLPVIGLAIIGSFALLGEFKAGEVAAAWRVLRPTGAPPEKATAWR